MSPSRILLAVALGALAAPVLAQDNKITVQNKIAQCQGCHGNKDWKTAYPEVYRVPKLAGQKGPYIVAALKAYKSGERSHPSMRGITATLTEDDMKKLADHYGAPAK